MVLKTIYLARHGFRLSWETQTWNAPTNTPRDPPLSAHGVTQAKELAAWLKALPDAERPQAIWSSPLYRCLQTATPAAEALQLPIYVEHGVSEWYLPAKRGLHPRCLPASRLTEWFPLIDPSNLSLLYPSQKGETIAQIHERAANVIQLLLDKWDKDGVETVILFTHAATNIALGRSLTGNNELDIRSATCSVGKYERRGDGKLGQWEQTMNGSTHFLERGEERHWEFSYVVEYEEDGVLEDGTDGPLASDNYKISSSPPGKL
ncbi:phosphoglycerate mutase-like protein [Meredithblackwellia eburnea MCA 4105]